jgi:cytochrome P450
VLDSGEPVPSDILTRLLTEKNAEGRQLREEELSDNLLNLLFAGECCRENWS